MSFRVTRKNALVAVGSAAAGAVLFWYLGGICYGYESYTARGHGGLLDFEASRRGYSVGPKRVYLRKGQTFAVAYDATIRAGTLRVRLFKPFDRDAQTGPTHYVTASGPGEYAVAVPESGFYTLLIADTGGEHDLEYTAKWSAR